MPAVGAGHQLMTRIETGTSAEERVVGDVVARCADCGDRAHLNPTERGVGKRQTHLVVGQQDGRGAPLTDEAAVGGHSSDGLWSGVCRLGRRHNGSLLSRFRFANSRRRAAKNEDLTAIARAGISWPSPRTPFTAVCFSSCGEEPKSSACTIIVQGGGKRIPRWRDSLTPQRKVTKWIMYGCKPSTCSYSRDVTAPDGQPADCEIRSDLRSTECTGLKDWR